MSDKPNTASTEAQEENSQAPQEKTLKINEIKVVSPEAPKDKTQSNPCCGSCT